MSEVLSRKKKLTIGKNTYTVKKNKKLQFEFF
jgi:hypothetical protein